MPWGMVAFLQDHPLIGLLAVLALGFFAGEVRLLGGFRFGMAAVLFVGIGFGWAVPGLAMPEILGMLGLTLFVYCLGLQAGPGFLASWKRDGLALSLAIIASLLVAAGLVALGLRGLGWSPSWTAGAFSGATTNTAALGAALEAAKSVPEGGWSVEDITLGYAILYPLGVFLTLLHIHLLALRHKAGSSAPAATLALPQPETFRIERLDPHGKPWTGDSLARRLGMVLTRFKPPGGEIQLVAPGSELPPGTLLVAIGTPNQLRELEHLVGAVASDAPLQGRFDGFEIARFFVSNRKAVGRPLRELGLDHFGAVITRLRRGDIELPVTAETTLNLGDRVRVLYYPGRREKVVALLGDSLSTSTETGYLSFSIGLMGGCLLGLLPLTLPGLDVPVRLGSAGGALLLALLLGRLGRTGPLVWQLPLTVNLTLRQFGISLFLAGAGLRAGQALQGGLPEAAWMVALLGVGALLAAQVTLLGVLWLRGRRELALVQGALCALQTQPAALAFAGRYGAPAKLNEAYAAAYPLAFVLKVVFVQFLLLT